MAICDLPFYPNNANYVDDEEHDANHRKYWFLILDCGLFTRKADADLCIEADKVLIFFTRRRAERRWAKHCRRNHNQADRAHQDDSPEPPEPPALARSSPVHAQTPASGHVEAPRQRSFRDDANEPAASTPAPAPPRAPAASTPGPTGSPARARSRTKTPASRGAPRKRKSPPLPLFRDDDEPSPPRRRSDQAPSAVNKGAKSVQAIRAPGATKAPAAVASPVPPSTAAASASPTHALSTAPRLARPAPHAEPPPVYTVEDSDSDGVYLVEGSDSDDTDDSEPPARPEPPSPTARDGISPSVSSASSLSSVGGSDGFPVGWGPAPASRVLVFPRAAASSASSASRAGLESPPAAAPSASSASRAGLESPPAAAPSASSASRAGLESPPAAAPSASSASRAGLRSPRAAASASASAVSRPRAVGASGGAEPVLLFNNSSQKLYKDAAMAIREMKEEESVEVVKYEEVVEFLSARTGRKAAGSV
ncbi:hypothetical protein B0H11DRAFT_2253916 [Mycena galericulata]|nr:hypothetical protein B0H11DRAFT_2253916 [Mycena galericulata]